MTMEKSFLDMDSPSAEELTWLQASVILDDTPPTPPPKDDDIFMKDISFHSRLTFDRRSARSPSPATTTGCSPTRNSSTTSSAIGHLTMSKRIVASAPSTPPRSEWIYRTLKTPPTTRQVVSNSTPYPKPHSRSIPKSHHSRSASVTVSRPQSGASNRARQTLSEDGHSVDTSGSSPAPFWSNVLHPRSRSERSVPLLKTIPSQSQIVFTPPDFPESAASTSTHFCTPPRRSTSSACSSRSMGHRRPPSVSSTLDSASTSNSPSSSRSESPVPMTPVSRSPSLCGTAPHPRANYHYTRHHRRPRTVDGHHTSTHPFSSSCPPSKSILARTSSSSTRDSSHTTSKSVKFAVAPVVHHSSKGYWDIESIADSSNMGINIESMDVDDDPFANHGSRERQVLNDGEFGRHRRAGRSFDLSELRELQCATPAPESHRARSRGIKRFINWKPATPATTTTTTITTNATPLTPPASPSPSHKSFNITPKRPTTPSGRPSISTPYALGTYPSPQPHFAATESTSSLPTRHWPSHPTPSTPSSLRHGINRDDDCNSTHQVYHRTPAGSVTISHPLSALPAGSLMIPVRTSPSCDSFRSAKSNAARSVRSMGSAKSTMSTRGFKAWFTRRIGWMDPVNSN